MLHGDVVKTRLSTNVVKFKRVSDEELEFFIASRSWYGKAGGCSIQEIYSLIPWISGTECSIRGLPLYEVTKLLTSCGLKPSIEVYKAFRDKVNDDEL